MPESLFHDLAQRANATSQSQSDIIRTALEAYLHGDSQTTISAAASCTERAGCWTAMMQGAADLSTNPSHLEGFGE
jgi:hypothetical protein